MDLLSWDIIANIASVYLAFNKTKQDRFLQKNISNQRLSDRNYLKGKTYTTKKSSKHYQ